MTDTDDLYDFFAANSFINEDEELRKFSGNENCLVHYTSAEAAAKIISNQQIWLRHVRYTNDKSEIRYGIEKFFDVFRDYRNSYYDVIDQIDPQKGREIFDEYFHRDLAFAHEDSYIVCFSNHERHEVNNASFGLLSMWRSYGRNNAVCIVLNSDHFINMSSEVKNAPLIKIRYKDGPLLVKREIERFLGIIQKNIELLKKNPVYSIDNIVHKLKCEILTLKHPSFSEEREYRVVFSPNIPSNIINGPDLTFINEKPQLVYNIPLDVMESDNNINYNIENIIDKIVIGPSDFQYENLNLFVHLLRTKGVKNPKERVVIADIPLRV